MGYGETKSKRIVWYGGRLVMESNKYLAQINMDLHYFEYIHHKSPEKIFMSYVLWSKIMFDDAACDIQSISYCGIPVQLYRSNSMEYYFALSGFVFEEE